MCLFNKSSSGSMKSNLNCRLLFPKSEVLIFEYSKITFKHLLFVWLLILTVSILFVDAYITEKMKK